MFGNSFKDKENAACRNMLLPCEKLGVVPEHTTIGGNKCSNQETKKKLTNWEKITILDGREQKDVDIDPVEVLAKEVMRQKLENIEMGLILDGEKRVAIIDPLQALNTRSRIARRLLVSPLQIMSNKKRTLDSLERIENGNRKKKMQSEKERVFFDEALRLNLFAGKMKGNVTKALIEREFGNFVKTVNKVQGVDESKVFDSCPEVVTKINEFLRAYTMVDRSLLFKYLKVHGNSFNAFLQGCNQERCDNVTYERAYIFFEKLRIHFGEPKSAARCFNENNHPNGFSLTRVVKKKGGFKFRAAAQNHDLC